MLSYDIVAEVAFKTLIHSLSFTISMRVIDVLRFIFVPTSLNRYFQKELSELDVTVTDYGFGKTLQSKNNFEK